MNKYKVVISDLTHKSYEIEKKIIKSIGAKLILKNCKTQDELIALTHDADALSGY